MADERCLRQGREAAGEIGARQALVLGIWGRAVMLVLLLWVFLRSEVAIRPRLPA